ncbi:MAG: glycosyltransferase family 2 protein, partial [Bacteroidaceae bacterium]|nr:glycosyltransferase family 2 protein [Bacteroidaceae bacterium]
LEKLGLIPEAYFMFFEETEWCFKAKRAGFRICGCRDAVIYHKESASMQDMSEFKTHFLGYNRVLFEKRTAGKGDFFSFCCYYLFQWAYRKLKRSKEQNSLKLFFKVISGKEEAAYRDYYRG